MAGDVEWVDRQFRLTKEQYDLIGEWAKEQDRSRTSMLRKLVDDEAERRAAAEEEKQAA